MSWSDKLDGETAERLEARIAELFGELRRRTEVDEIICREFGIHSNAAQYRISKHFKDLGIKRSKGELLLQDREYIASEFLANHRECVLAKDERGRMPAAYVAASNKSLELAAKYLLPEIEATGLATGTREENEARVRELIERADRRRKAETDRMATIQDAAEYAVDK